VGGQHAPDVPDPTAPGRHHPHLHPWRARGIRRETSRRVRGNGPCWPFGSSARPRSDAAARHLRKARASETSTRHWPQLEPEIRERSPFWEGLER